MPPPADQPDQLIEQFEIAPTGAKAQKWLLELYDRSIRITLPGGVGHAILRESLPRCIELIDNWIVRRSLMVKTDSLRMSFKLDPQTFDAVKQWIGPPTAGDLVAALSKRLKWNFIIAVFFVIVSVPIHGDPSAGVEPRPFDLIGCSLAVSLMAISVLAKLRPRRAWLLLNTIWLAALAANVVRGIYTGRLDWLWLLLLAGLLLAAATSLKLFRRFNPKNLAKPTR